MTPHEKQLEQRAQTLERRVTQILALNGVKDALLDEFEREEALDAMSKTGDKTLLCAYLNKINGRRA